MHKKIIMGWGALMLLAAILLPGCTPSGPAATPTKDAQAVYTQAAEAVFSELTQSALLTPSATPQPPPPTATAPVIPTLAATPTTADLSTTTPAATITSTALASTDDLAEIVTQSVPDKSTFAAGQSFKVTWTLKNTGKTTWATTYGLKWFGGLKGDGLTIPNTVNLANEVKPGDMIDVTISFTAPKNVSSARTIWYLQNMLTGTNFLKLMLDIGVTGPTATPSVTPTGATTSTATSTPMTPTATAVTPTVTPTQ